MRVLSRHEVEQGRTIAGLLDAELERRRNPGLARWTSTELGITTDLLVLVTDCRGLELDLMALRLASLLPLAVTIVDPELGTVPRFRTIDLGDEVVEVPAAVRAVIPSGEGQDFPFGVELRPIGEKSFLFIAVPRSNAAEARWMLSSFEAAARHQDHPYRRRTLRVGLDAGELQATVVRDRQDHRGSLVLDGALWEGLDRDVHAPLRHAERLQQRGLGASRGVLLHGPPGTGKTAVCRVLAAEAAGTATVLLPSAAAISQALDEVFALARALAPTLLILEDVDLVAGRRGARADRGLASFLENLDGLLTGDEAIVTLASTNDPDALDAAATRSSRIDRIVELPPPGAEARRRIWERYLAEDAELVNLDTLAALSAGATGADIREIVRSAILSGALPTTAHYRQLVAEQAPTAEAYGQYL